MAHIIMDHGVSGCFGTSLAPKSASTTPESVIPHSLSCFANEMVGTGLKCRHATFYGREGLFAHRSVFWFGTAEGLPRLMNWVLSRSRG